MLITYVYSGLNMSRWKSGCGNGSSLSCVLDKSSSVSETSECLSPSERYSSHPVVFILEIDKG